MRRERTNYCLEKVFELSSDLVIITTSIGNIEMTNPAFQHLLGYPQDEMKGRNILEFIHPDDQELVIQRYNALVADSNPTDIRFINKQGCYLWLSWKCHPNPEDEQNIIIAQDISRTREANEIIKKSESLKRLNKELTHFKHLLSHDIKEPIRNIVSFSNLVLKEIPSDTKLQEYLHFIIDGGKQLQLLINNLVTYDNISNQQVYMLQDIDLQLIANRLELSMRKLICEKNAQFIYPKLPKIYGNESFIFLSLKYLLENGLLYNESPQPVVELQYHASATKHEFLITDNGIGIAPQYHDYVFNMFKRLHNRQQYQGAGIGLSIAKKILEKMNGEISIVHSTPGEGSTFLVSFPIIQQAKPLERPARRAYA